ncbi:MAG: threonylcarbamoyl-AMP synthase [Anaplasmataceae bacterium]|nr:threonylcarbamoyl-AMP synthase [Anaplasmataceae bacterium]
MPIDPIPHLISLGQIGVLLTDTIYGLVGQAFNKEAVQRIYRVRKRSPQKPCIILIGSIKDLNLFEIKLSSEEKKIIKKIWPGAVSIVFPLARGNFHYLHRGTKSLAFRLPQSVKLQKIIKKTGPLIAPSANPEGFPPAESIPEAIHYFGGKIDFYKNDGPPRAKKPSTLLKIDEKKKEVVIIRSGAVHKKDLHKNIPEAWRVKAIS